MSPARSGHAARDTRQPRFVGPVRLTADDVMTARDVAQLLHAPVSTVEDWARRGILPSVKIGKRRLFIRQNIEMALVGWVADDRSDTTGCASFIRTLESKVH